MNSPGDEICPPAAPSIPVNKRETNSNGGDGGVSRSIDRQKDRQTDRQIHLLDQQIYIVKSYNIGNSCDMKNDCIYNTSNCNYTYCISNINYCNYTYLSKMKKIYTII